jgi:hypothetical protein
MFPICSYMSSTEYMLLTYHDENRHGTTDRPATEIEITEEMIEAGVVARAMFSSGDEAAVVVHAIYSAMSAARPSRSPG